MGPAAGFDEHRDLVGHRQPVGSGQDGADAPGFGSSVDVFMPVRSRDAATRDSNCFVRVSMAVAVEPWAMRTRSSTAAPGRARPDIALEGAST